MHWPPMFHMLISSACFYQNSLGVECNVRSAQSNTSDQRVQSTAGIVDVHEMCSHVYSSYSYK